MSRVTDPVSATTEAQQGRWVSACLPFIVGGSSGMVATVCIQPIDLIKVRLQLAGEGARTGSRPTAFSIARTIVTQGKVTDLYQGLSAGLLRQVVYGTARLGLFFTFEDMTQQRLQRRGLQMGFEHRALAGLAAGGLGALVANPTEVALIRMQSDGLQPKELRANYRSAFDTLARISRNEGILALWSGAFPTMIRAMATNFGQLAFFSESKHQLSTHTTLGPQAQTICASTIAGISAAFFSLPFDFLKTRLQRANAATGTPVYRGMWHCALEVARNEGLPRFYRGFGAYLFRIAPHSIIALVVADNINAVLKQAQ
ncbi:uncharacterized protein A1O5_02066 [Cladophialophora psammophila CBS 110553]|uniref:Uncharacterized protein n=1 Tax=Cladophialophora psammophila CBS 110553 TaxID=1182543 RepID=W9XDI3_9EURO|nr:uncharacterized protein A1O5_02066 [Cladophialophora psammophila CBS 110553]EXJ75370.1 hypothetical protein A1O5_02066 [Cladophialophora psammophila CBS 110553]